MRSEEHTSELQSRLHLVCRLLLEKKKKKQNYNIVRSPRLCLLCHHHLLFFFFNDTATTEIYTLSLHDALPISIERTMSRSMRRPPMRRTKERSTLIPWRGKRGR